MYIRNMFLKFIAIYGEYMRENRGGKPPPPVPGPPPAFSERRAFRECKICYRFPPPFISKIFSLPTPPANLVPPISPSSPSHPSCSPPYFSSPRPLILSALSYIAKISRGFVKAVYKGKLFRFVKVRDTIPLITK